MKSPKFSVIVPCYNQEKYITETLDSLRSQTFQNWECIVVNDGSTDNSQKIVEDFCSKDSRFKLINQENKGVAATRNAGIRKASGEFILPLDGDDKIGKDYLKLADAEFAKNFKLKLVYCEANFFGAKNEKWNLVPYDYETLIFVNCIFNAAIFRKEDYKKTDGYDENMKFGYEDWEFWLQLLQPNDQVKQIKSVQFYYRISENSRNSFLNNTEKLKLTEKYIKEKHAGKYAEVLGHNFTMEGLMQMHRDQQLLRKIKKTVFYKSFYKIEKGIRNIF